MRHTVGPASPSNVLMASALSRRWLVRGFGHQVNNLLRFSHNGFVDLDLRRSQESWHDNT